MSRIHRSHAGCGHPRDSAVVAAIQRIKVIPQEDPRGTTFALLARAINMMPGRIPISQVVWMRSHVSVITLDFKPAPGA
ncbi:hypothetical protein KCP78_13955 [Salmonella enterica subsp. enterica]|nr:hypothetical protein KCP78_13955 [Salmonella enterica subsp. enterica]